MSNTSFVFLFLLLSLKIVNFFPFSLFFTVNFVQVESLQDKLQALDTTSKTQQDLSNRTIRELRDQLTLLTADTGHKDQQLLSLRRERDRLNRELQTKV